MWAGLLRSGERATRIRLRSFANDRRAPARWLKLRKTLLQMSILEGKRILVVEDSPVVAELADEMLRNLGCVVIGPAPNMAQAREFAEEEPLDAAIVDVRIRGEKAFPICEILASRSVPFLLTSGYGDWDLPLKWADSPTLPKPYTLEDVEIGLAQLLT